MVSSFLQKCQDVQKSVLSYKLGKVCVSTVVDGKTVQKYFDTTVRPGANRKGDSARNYETLLAVITRMCTVLLPYDFTKKQNYLSTAKISIKAIKRWTELVW